jgi:hypothetical protein
METAIQTSSSGCNAILNNLKRHAAFSLSLLSGGKRASKRGDASTGRESGVTVRPSFIGRIGIIIRCRLHSDPFATLCTQIVATTTCRAFDAAAPRGDCATPFSPHRLRSLPLGGLSDHLRRPRDALRLFRPFPPRGRQPKPLRCGCADHHEVSLDLAVAANLLVAAGSYAAAPATTEKGSGIA